MLKNPRKERNAKKQKQAKNIKEVNHMFSLKMTARALLTVIATLALTLGWVSFPVLAGDICPTPTPGPGGVVIVITGVPSAPGSGANGGPGTAEDEFGDAVGDPETLGGGSTFPTATPGSWVLVDTHIDITAFSVGPNLDGFEITVSDITIKSCIFGDPALWGGFSNPVITPTVSIPGLTGPGNGAAVVFGIMDGTPAPAPNPPGAVTTVNPTGILWDAPEIDCGDPVSGSVIGIGIDVAPGANRNAIVGDGHPTVRTDPGDPAGSCDIAQIVVEADRDINGDGVKDDVDGDGVIETTSGTRILNTILLKTGAAAVFTPLGPATGGDGILMTINTTGVEEADGLPTSMAPTAIWNQCTDTVDAANRPNSDHSVVRENFLGDPAGFGAYGGPTDPATAAAYGPRHGGINNNGNAWCIQSNFGIGDVFAPIDPTVQSEDGIHLGGTATGNVMQFNFQLFWGDNGYDVEGPFPVNTLKVQGDSADANIALLNNDDGMLCNDEDYLHWNNESDFNGDEGHDLGAPGTPGTDAEGAGCTKRAVLFGNVAIANFDNGLEGGTDFIGNIAAFNGFDGFTVGTFAPCGPNGFAHRFSGNLSLSNGDDGYQDAGNVGYLSGLAAPFCGAVVGTPPGLGPNFAITNGFGADNNADGGNGFTTVSAGSTGNDAFATGNDTVPLAQPGLGPVSNVTILNFTDGVFRPATADGAAGGRYFNLLMIADGFVGGGINPDAGCLDIEAPTGGIITSATVDAVIAGPLCGLGGAGDSGIELDRNATLTRSVVFAALGDDVRLGDNNGLDSARNIIVGSNDLSGNTTAVTGSGSVIPAPGNTNGNTIVTSLRSGIKWIGPAGLLANAARTVVAGCNVLAANVTAGFVLTDGGILIAAGSNAFDLTDDDPTLGLNDPANNNPAAGEAGGVGGNVLENNPPASRADIRHAGLATTFGRDIANFSTGANISTAGFVVNSDREKVGASAAACAANPAPPPAPQASNIVGDVNKDGKVTQTDVDLLNSYLKSLRKGFKGTPVVLDAQQKLNADIAKSCGMINANDLTLLKRFVKNPAKPLKSQCSGLAIGQPGPSASSANLAVIELGSAADSSSTTASVRLYDLNGKLILEQSALGNKVELNSASLVNGVYLYVATVRNAKGEVISSELRKLVIRH